MNIYKIAEKFRPDSFSPRELFRKLLCFLKLCKFHRSFALNKGEIRRRFIDPAEDSRQIMNKVLNWNTGHRKHDYGDEQTVERHIIRFTVIIKLRIVGFFSFRRFFFLDTFLFYCFSFHDEILTLDIKQIVFHLSLIKFAKECCTARRFTNA